MRGHQMADDSIFIGASRNPDDSYQRPEELLLGQGVGGEVVVMWRVPRRPAVGLRPDLDPHVEHTGGQRHGETYAERAQAAKGER